VDLTQVVTEGVLGGPAVYAAGAILSTTGGHAELHAYPLSWTEDFSRRDGVPRLADGAAECMRAVREQLRRGTGDQGLRVRRRASDELVPVGQEPPQVANFKAWTELLAGALAGGQVQRAPALLPEEDVGGDVGVHQLADAGQERHPHGR
jgi:hypothetical protein